MQDSFLDRLWRFYDQHRREMPWRIAEANGSFDPYKILVSEIMLQQTQVPRVIPKYEAFINEFPNCKKLAISDLSKVLELWSGLGYNRRAKYLHEAAKALNEMTSFPEDIATLTRLKGVGYNTAAAVLVYSFNQPHIFIETNIRTVMLHEFFADNEEQVDDKQLEQKLSEILDRENPRDFYWAMMDYGAYLKSQGLGSLSKSKAHKKQSKFEGSRRQLRGEVLRAAQRNMVLNDIAADDRLQEVVDALIKEGLVVMQGQQLSIAQ